LILTLAPALALARPLTLALGQVDQMVERVDGVVEAGWRGRVGRRRGDRRKVSLSRHLPGTGRPLVRDLHRVQ
jgi:hypothetical protein